MQDDPLWLEATKETLAGYRRLLDAAVEQLSDEQFFARPLPGMNSVATILRHLGGNLQSRWTDFLTEDGEKPDRDRDQEFADWTDTREALNDYFDQGWQRMSSTLDSLTPKDCECIVRIRGEEHTVPQAIQRSLTHISYHVGQLMLIARLAHGDDSSWRWLTIRPGGSGQHNESTWGSPASRGVAGEKCAE